MPVSWVQLFVAQVLCNRVAVEPAVLSARVTSAQSKVTVSGQVSLYQSERPVAPLGAVKVCAIELSPFVALVLPSCAQNAPPWQPALITVSEAPEEVQPLKLPVSKSPFTIPPPGGGVPVTVSATGVVREPEMAVPVTVMVELPVAAPELTVAQSRPVRSMCNPANVARLR